MFRVGDQQIPVQVNCQRGIDPVRDTQGIKSFVDEPANRAPFGLLINQEDTPPINDAWVVTMPLSTVMLLA